MTTTPTTESSRQSDERDGRDLPQPKPFPGQDGYGLLVKVIAFPFCALAAAACASALFGGVEKGGIGLIIGVVLAFWFSSDIQDTVCTSLGKKHYRNHSAENPDDADAALQAGMWVQDNTISNTHEFKKAEKYLRKAIAISPNHRGAIVRLAYSMFLRNSFDEVVSLLDPWLSNRNDAQAHIILASALKELGQHARAASEFRAALRIYPDIQPPLTADSGIYR